MLRRLAESKHYCYLCSLSVSPQHVADPGQLAHVLIPNLWLCSLPRDISVKRAWPQYLPEPTLFAERQAHIFLAQGLSPNQGGAALGSLCGHPGLPPLPAGLTGCQPAWHRSCHCPHPL